MIDKLVEESWTLQARVLELENAIRKHASATGHNLCWENDVQLWSVIGITDYPHHTLPEQGEFEDNCKQYYESRKKCLEEQK
jgi:hypothetical protein